MADPLPRNSKAEQNADQIERELARRDQPRPPFGGGGFQGLGRPPGAPRPAGQANPPQPNRPNPFQAPRPANPLQEPRPAAAPQPRNPFQAMPPARPAIPPQPAPRPAVRRQPSPIPRIKIVQFFIQLLFLSWSVIIIGDILGIFDSHAESPPPPAIAATATLSREALMPPPTPTALPDKADCTVSGFETDISVNPVHPDGSVLIFRVYTHSSGCLGIPLRVGVWLERVNEQPFFAPNAAPLYRLDSGLVTLQTQLTPNLNQDAKNLAEFILPLRELGLPAGSYRLDGNVDARTWETGRQLKRVSFSTYTLTLP